MAMTVRVRMEPEIARDVWPRKPLPLRLSME